MIILGETPEDLLKRLLDHCNAWNLEETLLNKLYVLETEAT